MDIQDLKKRKLALKLTTADLADMIDIPYGTLSKIFTGETKKPLYITVEKIDRALTRLEQEKRIKAYQEAIGKYVENHPEEEFDPNEFEKLYRRENQLTADPIPFAVPLDGKPEGTYIVNPSAIVTVEEFLKIDPDRFTELIDGKVVTAQTPSFVHQALLEELGDNIKQYIAKNKGKCKVYTSGVAIRPDQVDQSILIPDIIVRCKGGSIQEFGILGAPDWVIEITSPSTRKRDYHIKYSKYLDAGVQEYWVIDLQKRVVTTYINDLPPITGMYQFEDEVPVFIYDNKLKIKISDLLDNIKDYK